MMKDDPVIQAIRDVRHQISESVGHDPQRLLEYYIKLQEPYKDQLVDLPQDDIVDSNLRKQLALIRQ